MISINSLHNILNVNETIHALNEIQRVTKKNSFISLGAYKNDTEKQIIDEVNSLKGKKTIIMIAHRLSTLENCDHIYKIDREGLKLEKS